MMKKIYLKFYFTNVNLNGPDFYCEVQLGDPVMDKIIKVFAGEEDVSNNWMKLHGYPMRRGKVNKKWKRYFNILASERWWAENGK